MEFTNLFSMFGNSVWAAVAFIIAISVIVAIHEYGHYIVGRWCGIKADVFSLGFGRVLFQRTDKHGTVWQLAAVPLGGFVKFRGDANAASAGTDADLEAMDAAARRETMHGAPLWARSLTVAAGPVFNFILSILVFAGFALYMGKPSEPIQVDELLPLPSSYGALEPGDRVLEIGGTPATDFTAIGALVKDLPFAASVPYLIERDGREIEVQGPYPLPSVVGSIRPRSAADEAGLAVGDVITAIDGSPVATFGELQEITTASEGRELALTIWRDGETLDFRFATQKGAVETEDGIEERWLIGMGSSFPFTSATQSVGPLESIGLGAERTYGVIASSLKGLKAIVFGDISACNLSGPIGMARAAGDSAKLGLDSFIWFIAAISTAIGLINLFPIPVLDGGHLVFHAYEAVTRRQPNERAYQLLMFVGLGLILAVMVIALTTDIVCP